MITPHSLEHSLNTLVAKAKTKWMIALWVGTLPWAVTLAGLAWVFAASWSTVSGLALVAIFAAFSWNYSRPTRPRFNLQNLCFHLNQKFPQLEHSAHLWIDSQNENASLIQQLQRQKLSPVLSALLQQPTQLLLPNYPITRPLLVSAGLLMIMLVLHVVDPIGQWRFGITGPSVQSAESNSSRLTVERVQVDITPPAYTGLPGTSQEQLDVQALQGATLNWTLIVKGGSEPEKELMIRFADGSGIAFTAVGTDQYQAKMSVQNSAIYHISGNGEALTPLHSIEMIRDTRPRIKILAPKLTITELAMSDEPRIEAQVLIEDDFALSKVEIIASVAKGSGEAVKFRDHRFAFDSQSEQGPGTLFSKHWFLPDLEMEPGDELYFSIEAWDNKAPEPQSSRSQTKIIRWLDEEVEGIASEGILIDFMPEYFKSQRQIIIETKELIADQNNLDKAQFDALSRALGQAQSDLKTRYGQYLGDEIDSGGAEINKERAQGQPEVHLNDGDHNDEHEPHQDDPQLAAGEHQHDHDAPQSGNSEDISGFSDVIAEFGHNHGDSEIGILTEQSPIALMKRAIAYMWDAELHLMLSDPQSALPHEENALKFLNRAKKAERIYVKRLGFEPPPVTEARRYQGDLSDIRQQQQDLSANPSEPFAAQLALLQALAQQQVNSTSSELWSDDLAEHIEQVKQSLILESQQRPGLMKSVATLERMLLRKTLWLNNCDSIQSQPEEQSCMETLMQVLWQQLPEYRAKPARQQPNFDPNHPLLEAYKRGTAGQDQGAVK